MTARSLLFAAGIASAWLASPAAAAPPDGVGQGIPGMQVHRIREPVYQSETYVYEAGRDKSRSIVLVHGLGDEGASSFYTIVPWLREHYHVVTFELPGFARATKANLAYSPTGYAMFVKYVVDKYVGQRPFVLLGHSMGGVIALRYAATFPAGIEKLVLVDTPGIVHRASFSSQFLTHLLSNYTRDYVPPVVNTQGKANGIAQQLVTRLEQFNLDPEIVHASPQLRTKVLGGNPLAIAGYGIVLEDFSNVLPSLKVPTLVIWGANDTLAPPRTGRFLATTIPGAQLAVIASAGHVPMIENPQAFRSTLEPFLNGEPVPAPAATPMRRHGNVRCQGKHNQVFEGEYEELILRQCDGAQIRNARIGMLRVFDSAITIDQSQIGGGEIGLHAHNATIVITGGIITGETAIYALNSRLDVAATRIRAGHSAMTAPVASSLIATMSEIESPRQRGALHGAFNVVPGKPL
ncbi:MAG: hypothetical protein AMJ84_02850 [Acidithiobacillales bacterium SM23_46]|nr:MAG: hypothetical protein AMJ84_02850 [Acidithiobacillales bacterium SM23_46]